MDRSLDETIAERHRRSDRGRRPPRPDSYSYPRDGIKKSSRDSRTNLDNDWVHDRFDDEPRAQHSAPKNRSYRNDTYSRESPDAEPVAVPRLRVDNLHYDLTEDDLYDLFERIGPVVTVSLRYDRAGRSDGTAFVTYGTVADARTAIREFDGANAKGQPIRLTLLPVGPAGGRARPAGRRDNPFDRVENPRTLFDRIEPPKGRSGGGRGRSASPEGYDSYDEIDSRRSGPRRGGAAPHARDRRSDVTKPPPENIDRYVPGQGDGRNSSRRNEGREIGRRPGERRERGGGSDRGRGGRDRSERVENGGRLVNGRPRKTQEELDAEMEDYWGNANAAGGDSAAPAANETSRNAAPATAAATDLDIDMIE